MADMSAQTNEEEQPASPATSQGGRAITRARFAFVFGFLLAILLYLLMWFSAGGVFVDGVRATAQAAAVFLAGGAVDEEHDTLVVSEETDEEGRSVIGLRVGGARVTVQSSVSSDALTN
ncbi:MAG: hypothetical protein Q8P16_00915, partial [bacterium]|nr:hypothetical protein [bacterium]